MHFRRNPSFAPCIMYFLIVLWAGCLLVAAIKEHQITPKRCRLENMTRGVNAYCLHLNLTSIPDYLPPNTITLDASFNQITALRNDSFQSIRRLTSLNLRHNLISDLDVGTFSPLTTLRTLDIGENMLTSLQSSIFDSNPLLSILVLTYNHLLSVPTEALFSLHRLQKIILVYNSIQTADFRAFSQLSKNAFIKMGGNDISSLEALDFTPLQNISLHLMDLSKNKIHILPERLFSHLKRVDILNLNNNKLHEFHVASFTGNITIHSLLVSACRIECIIPLDNSNVSNMTFPTIYSVDMSVNIISYIPPFAFGGFNNTRKFNIKQNRIAEVSVKSFCGLDSLNYLDISHNPITYLHPSMFSCNPFLHELIILHCKILVLNPAHFKGLLELRTLDLSHNLLIKLEDGQEWNNPALTFLDISHNQFEKINRDVFRGSLANLQILDASFNGINSYSPLTFDNVPTLRELYLNSQKTQMLSRVFSHMKKLVKLDLSFADAHLNSTRQFTETRSLELLRMRQNNLKSVDLFDHATQSSLFDGLVSLKNLNLRGNFMNSLQPGVFKSLSKLKALDLSKASIVILKPGVFEGLTSLRTLYLSENEILTTSTKLFLGLDYLGSLYFQNGKLEVLDMDIFTMTPLLRNLFLSGNQLTKVHKKSFLSTNHTLKIDVSANPLSCTCELSWFINWLQASKADLLKPNRTRCYRTSFTEVVDQPILMFNPSEFCGVNIALITTLSFFGVIVGFLCIIAYRRRLWLSYKFFLLKVAIIGHKEIAEDFNEDIYEFHLNLMFHEAEEEWVYRVMKPALEERMPHLQNIAYGDDYLELGVFYVNAIYAAIENSFKTVLLLSNQSINDAWFLTKLRMALEHLNDTRLNKVILIFVENIDNDHLPYLVRLFLSRNKPYMLWTDDEDGQELFWAKFEKSMRANRAFNNVIPV